MVFGTLVMVGLCAALIVFGLYVGTNIIKADRKARLQELRRRRQWRRTV